MPVFNYKCETCSKSVDILRPANEQSEPTIEEGGVCSTDEKHGVTPHAWKKIILPPRVSFSHGWAGGGGGKGHWGKI